MDFGGKNGMVGRFHRDIHTILKECLSEVHVFWLQVNQTMYWLRLC